MFSTQRWDSNDGVYISMNGEYFKIYLVYLKSGHNDK